MDIINKPKETSTGNWPCTAQQWRWVPVAGRRDPQSAAEDIRLDEGKIVVRREIAKNRTQREPRLMALADWG